jgi:hypothetical protein
MTKVEAIAALETVAAGWEALREAAERDGTDCFWCCGGGDEWRAELEAREDTIRAEHPNLG